MIWWSIAHWVGYLGFVGSLAFVGGTGRSKRAVGIGTAVFAACMALFILSAVVGRVP